MLSVANVRVVLIGHCVNHEPDCRKMAPTQLSDNLVPTTIKIVKSARHYTEAAEDEVKLLRKIRDTNPAAPGRHRAVLLLDDFRHYGMLDSVIHTSLMQRCVRVLKASEICKGPGRS